MESSRDKRRFVRRPLQREVFCYLDGNRLDGESVDISLGGMFLQTRSLGDVPMGALVALVFKSPADPNSTSFLFGRVVRTQQAPVPGVGLKWERAVSSGTANGLVGLLRSLFGVDRPKIQEKPGAKGQPKFVYEFNAPAVPGGNLDGGAMPYPAPPCRLDAPPANLADVEVTVVHGDAARRPPAGTMPHPVTGRGGSFVVDEHPGTLTQQIDTRTVRIPTQFEASLKIDGATLPVQVREIGVSALVVQSPLMPVDRAAQVDIWFDVLTPEGAVPLNCRCRQIDSAPVGRTGTPEVTFEISSCDEGPSPGIFRRYLKWLHFHSLAKA